MSVEAIAGGTADYANAAALFTDASCPQQQWTVGRHLIGSAELSLSRLENNPAGCYSGPRIDQYFARRIDCVSAMVEEGRESLADIAYTFEFSSQAHITTTFAKHMGVTPWRYRQEVRG